jgi:hypothetical protein
MTVSVPAPLASTGMVIGRCRYCCGTHDSRNASPRVIACCDLTCNSGNSGPVKPDLLA